MPTPQQSGDKKPDRLQGQGNAIEAILAQVGDKSANELTFGTAEGEIDLTETNLTENQIRRYAELKQLVKETKTESVFSVINKIIFTNQIQKKEISKEEIADLRQAAIAEIANYLAIEPAINAVDLPDCRGDDYKNAYREYRNTLETKIDDSLGFTNFKEEVKKEIDKRRNLLTAIANAIQEIETKLAPHDAPTSDNLNEVEQALYHCNFFRAVPMENSRLSDTHLARPSDKPAGINEINA
ncbi:7926_t:CDS:2 [Entrophospora sp. SA101]|nr:7926_t:CDS:2 [Entrophospora sp. SA101]